MKPEEWKMLRWKWFKKLKDWKKVDKKECDFRQALEETKYKLKQKEKSKEEIKQTLNEKFLEELEKFANMS